MADTKISALTDGSPLVATDDIPIARGAANFRIRLSAAGAALLDDANAAAQLVTLGFAASITELNYTDGVTSAIQTQLNAKAASLGADDNYVTDAEKAVIGNTSGTNTGDQSLGGLQPIDADLTAIAALASAANKVPYSTGAQAWALADFSAAGRALVDDADASAQRTTLGLGTISTQTAFAVNVKDFGATGDGVTDDTAAIQAAIDEASDQNNGFVILPGGEYKITSTLTLWGVRIVGTLCAQGSAGGLDSVLLHSFNGDFINFTAGNIGGGLENLQLRNVGSNTGTAVTCTSSAGVPTGYYFFNNLIFTGATDGFERNLMLNGSANAIGIRAVFLDNIAFFGATTGENITVNKGVGVYFSNCVVVTAGAAVTQLVTILDAFSEDVIWMGGKILGNWTTSAAGPCVSNTRITGDIICASGSANQVFTGLLGGTFTNSGASSNLVNGHVHELTETTAPAAPAANKALLYAQDNGSGITEVMALFSSGVAKEIVKADGTMRITSGVNPILVVRDAGATVFFNVSGAGSGAIVSRGNTSFGLGALDTPTGTMDCAVLSTNDATFNLRTASWGSFRLTAKGTTPGTITLMTQSTVPMSFGTNGVVAATITTAQKFGIATTAADKVLEVNLGTADAFRLTYNDSTGSAVTYMDTTLSSAGVTTFTAAGSEPTFVFSHRLRKKGYTVAALGALATPVAGDCAFVTDALAPAFLAAVAGGGAAYTPVTYTGAAWVCG